MYEDDAARWLTADDYVRAAELRIACQQDDDGGMQDERETVDERQGEDTTQGAGDAA